MLWKAKLDDQWYATVSGEHEGKYLPVASEPQAKHEDAVRRGLASSLSDDVSVDDKPVLPYLIKETGEIMSEGGEVWADAVSEHETDEEERE